jgi:prepilin-type N-terminal cleavage/methylation domain-containing protein
MKGQPQSPANRRGYTLVEVMIVLAIIASMIGFGWHSYRQHQIATMLTLLRTNMMTNVAFLEQYYDEHGQYKATPSTWPTLPVQIFSGLGRTYVIKFSTTPRNTDPGRFVLRASWYDANNGLLLDYMDINQDMLVKHCYFEGGKEVCVLMK